MSRPIKFRAWHTKKKVMFSCEEMVTDQMCLLTDGRFINASSTDTRLSHIDEGGVMIPLQFTGLLDKNGKEIWEGDIVKLTWCEGYGKGEEIGKIIYNAPVFFAIIHSQKTRSIHETGTIREVIGNVYENPDLLKGAL